MSNISTLIKNVRNTMRQDRGVSGDAQRLEQLGWLLFLKILDEKDQELEIINKNHKSVIPKKYQWRNWAADPEGITGDELISFIDNETHGLFANLKNIKTKENKKLSNIIFSVFDGSNNYMKSGYELRKVINYLNGFDFKNSEDKQLFGTVYESILLELRDAGNKGEFYTPRAITKFMTQIIKPKLGEKILDPSCGTGGFLTNAVDFVRKNYIKKIKDESILEDSIEGWELKPVSYVLGLTNLILHNLNEPNLKYIDSLKIEYNKISNKDQVDIILANPPFGASIADGVETNFPTAFRCRESADLFIVLMIKILKKNGRAAIVLPDGSITGDGYRVRIREKLLNECNVHTIIRMPTTTFFPASVPTNLVFFDKGKPTKDIWFYEHKLPEGQLSYSKTKEIQFEEFGNIIKWWNNRKENECAWKINIKNLKDYDLDIKNPNASETHKDLSIKEALINMDKSLDEMIEEFKIIKKDLKNEN